MYSGRGRSSLRRMYLLRKAGEAYGILGQGILIKNNRWFLKKKESAICYFCIENNTKNNMENAKKALTFGAKRNKLNERVEKGNVFLMRK